MEEAIDLREYGQRFAFGLTFMDQFMPVPLDPRFGTITVQKVHSSIDPALKRRRKVQDVPVVRVSEANDESLKQLRVMDGPRDFENIFTVDSRASLPLRGMLEGQSVDFI